MMYPKVGNNPAAYPDAETAHKGEFQVDAGSAILVYRKHREKPKTGL